MSVYKSLTTSDVLVTPFKVNKNFSFQGASAITDYHYPRLADNQDNDGGKK